jgi:acyl-coenzyme A synthetase/AMP-(fatty) acid ligase
VPDETRGQIVKALVALAPEAAAKLAAAAHQQSRRS